MVSLLLGLVQLTFCRCSERQALLRSKMITRLLEDSESSIGVQLDTCRRSFDPELVAHMLSRRDMDPSYVFAMRRFFSSEKNI